MTKPHVFIAVPFLGFEIGWSVADFCRRAARMDLAEDSPYRFTSHWEQNKTPYHHARNSCTWAFLESGADIMLCLDSDIRVPPNALDLLKHDTDIAAGVYPAWNSQGEGKPHVPQLVAPRPKDPKQRVYEADWAATGIMAIKRRVFESPEMLLDDRYTDPYTGKVEHEGVKVYWRFRYKPSGNTLLGEDIDFCMRAKAAGFKITVDGNVIGGHIKEMDVGASLIYGMEQFEKGMALGRGEV